MLTDTTKSPYAKLKPLNWNAFKWTDGFWKETVDNCNSATMPHLQNMFESANISHVVENFRICADPSDTRPHAGTVFGDGDFYKWMESAMYTAAANQDETLWAQLEDYVQLIAKAQLPDGYLSTKQIIKERNGTGTRMGDINEFEVYNMGHLFTSACLYYRLCGRESFLDVAKKAADYLEHMYLEAKEKGEAQTAVCPSHYMGLIEMYRTTGDKKYLDLARLSIELRDSVQKGMDDNQDRLPLKTHKKIVGHAVRATYLYAGVADLYAEEGDPEYLEMLHRVWDNMVSSKIYITGGIGALYNGASPYGYFFRHNLVHQAFGYEYQLPNITAYNETCASIGLVFWAYRMYLIEPKAEYMDILERAMLNVNLAAVSLDGDSFFYENMLRRTKRLDYRLIWRLRRAKYILSYCCPPNLARTISQSGEYAYTTSEDAVYLGLYGASKADISLGDFEGTLVQETSYPYDGAILLRTENVKKDGPLKIMVRIPGWVQSGHIAANGKTIALTEADASTYKEVILNNASETIQIAFYMPVRFTIAHPKVEECTNSAAIERGPLVYCLESMDADVDSLDELLLDINASFTPKEYTIKNRTLMSLEGQFFKAANSQSAENAGKTENAGQAAIDGSAEQAGNSRLPLYQTLKKTEFEPVNVRLIPYFAWDNRSVEDDGSYDVWAMKNKLDTPDDMEYDEMKIWLPLLRR